MSQDIGDMDRRTVLKGAGVAGAAAVTGGAGLLAATGGAAAASSDFSAGDPNAVTTDDGRIKEVYIQPTGDVEWDGFDEPVESLEVVIESLIQGDGEYEEQFRDTFNVSGGTEGSWTYDDCGRISLYDENHRIEEFRAEEDGGQKQTVVGLKATVYLRNADGDLADPASEAELSDDAEFTVTVNNREATASATGQAKPGVKADTS